MKLELELNVSQNDNKYGVDGRQRLYRDIEGRYCLYDHHLLIYEASFKKLRGVSPAYLCSGIKRISSPAASRGSVLVDAAESNKREKDISSI